eukprot:10461507-Lingulodinium_polyedra.AAC.1
MLRSVHDTTDASSGHVSGAAPLSKRLAMSPGGSFASVSSLRRLHAASAALCPVASTAPAKSRLCAWSWCQSPRASFAA